MLKIKRTSILAWVLFLFITILVMTTLVNTVQNRASTPIFSDTVARIAWSVLPVEFAFLAALIVSRQSRNLIGWLLMLPALAVASDVLKIYFSQFREPPVAPGPAFLLALSFSGWSWILLIFPILLILVYFPTGKPPSPGWRRVSSYIYGIGLLLFFLVAFESRITSPDGNWSVTNPLGFIPPDWLDRYLNFFFGIGLLTTTLLAVISVGYRYRKSTDIVREQIKWLLYACILFAVTYLLSLAAAVNHLWIETPGVFQFLMAIGVMSMPAAIAVAILRYRLWDIDVIIRKTLIYAVLTVAIAITYFGSVILMQQTFGALTGVDKSPVAIVLSTLAIAALFTPLRRNIQEFIDRRFYRKKYNANQALARFAALAGTETNIDYLSLELLTLVRETVQPVRVSLWIRSGRSNRP